MTETQAAMALYTDILVVIALILFIVNQVVSFYKEASMEMTLRKVRKIKSDKMSNHSVPTEKPSVKRDKMSNNSAITMPEIKIPEFSWTLVLGWMVAIIFTVSVLIGIYITLFYQP